MKVLVAWPVAAPARFPACIGTAAFLSCLACCHALCLFPEPHATHTRTHVFTGCRRHVLPRALLQRPARLAAGLGGAAALTRHVRCHPATRCSAAPGATSGADVTVQPGCCTRGLDGWRRRRCCWHRQPECD